jgi:selenide,water dikinase
MRPPLPQTRDIVLVGGGHTHALVLRKWGMDPLPGARLTLIDPGPTAAYSGMLPGHVAGHYDRAALDIDLVRLARFAGARLILDRATGLDLSAGTISLAGRPPVAFDIASLDIGIHGEMPRLPGFAEHAIAAKPLGRFASAWARFRDGLTAGETAQAVVIGGGVAGVELAMAMAHGARARGAGLAVTVVDRGAILPGVLPATARRLRAAARDLGIAFHEATPVRRVTDTGVTLEGGESLASAFTVGAAGARPYPWLAETGLALHEGFVSVTPTLQAQNAPQVFAVGDCAHLTYAPRPKAGVYAVRAAPVLHANLRAALEVGRFRRFRPQKDYLKLISMGGRSAVADRGGLTLSGRVLWRWKDRIDRKFMAKLSDLPQMAPPPLPAAAAPGVAEALTGPAPCGGCGAKVGAAALRAALAPLPRIRGDVETGAGDDAAVLRLGGTRQVITTDHLRAVTDDPYVMARIAARHALGDVLAMGAAPQAALPALVLPPLSPRLQARTLAEIMAAAAEVFAAAGAEIVGGHSATGAELVIGFTVTGLLDGPAVTVAGARPGDALILTKPLGSGTVMAAEMAGIARPAEVAAALEAMQADGAPAARLLRAAHAMTDVTGFGLAGHLMAMLDASGTGAELWPLALPLLPGAERLASAGIRSTLFEANAQNVAGRLTGPDSPLKALLLDPQTAGGFLAAVPAAEAAPLLDALHAAGAPAARIGRITDGAPRIALTAGRAGL